MSSSNTDRLKQAFSSSLGIELERIVDDLKYADDWDSVAHMTLVAAIEDEFDIMLDTADVIDMSSFLKAKEILTKYGIAFDAAE